MLTYERKRNDIKRSLMRGGLMSKGKYPAGELADISGDDFVGNIINDTLVITAGGKPATLDELRERIHRYFERCSTGNLRPGYESISCALNIDRVTFWRWRRGEGCDEAWSNECKQAARVIDSFLEQSMLQGKISPPSGIFLMKNWLSYHDTISIADGLGKTEERRSTPDAIARKHGIVLDEQARELPQAGFAKESEVTGE